MDEIDLAPNDLKHICRLCLRHDEISISIFERFDPNPNKRPLSDRIYDFYQIKICQSDGLPTNICHRCLYYTEIFTDFRDNIQKCENKLQNLIVSQSFLMKNTEQQPTVNVTQTNNLKLLPDESNIVMVVDPSKDYTTDEDTNESEDLVENDEPASKTKATTKSSRTTENDGFKNIFFCQYCDMAFINQADCYKHELTHDMSNPHQCNFCAFNCSSRNTIIAHIKECHEPDKPFFCIQCGKKFGRRSDLKKHSIVHTGIRPFNCPVCGKNFSRNTNLTKHLRIHSGLKPHVCQQCPRSFTTKGDLFRHTLVHADAKPFHCIKCPATFSRKDKFLTHERMHLKKEDTENMIISLNPFLNVDNNEEDRLLRPPETLTSGTMAAVPKSDALPIESTSEKFFPGHVTGDASLYPPDTERRPVNKPKKFFCDNCPKRFTTQSSLLNHKNVHLGLRNHVCVVCAKAFVRKRELDRHSVIHTGFKPYTCKYCNKRFGRKDKLVRHERIHLEEKSFSCTECQMTFTRKDTLMLHMQIHFEPGDNNVPTDLSIRPNLNKPLIEMSQETHDNMFKPLNMAAQPVGLTQEPPQPLQQPPQPPPQQHFFYRDTI